MTGLEIRHVVRIDPNMGVVCGL